jgi:hypothetical protein
MKKTYVLIFCTAILWACGKEPGALKLSEIVKGGCALEKGATLKSAQISDVDKVTYTFSNNNLELLVGFNSTCCTTYETNSSVKGDSIIIKITTLKPGSCNCICYYNYNFKFDGSGDSFKYKISVDNILSFNGIINH